MTDVKKEYSLVIVGAGPAALSAAVYASRYNIDNIMVGEALGGLAFEAHKVCNFPSEIAISGMELVQKMQKHAESLGSTLLLDKVVGIDKENEKFIITTAGGKKIIANTVLLAIGTTHRKLNLPNEEKYIGKGVSYCATCDAMFFRDKTVAVIGGSDSAHTASLYLADVAKKVYQIYRQEKFRGEPAWVDQVLNNKKIEPIFNTQVVELAGDEKLEKIILDRPYKNKKEILLDGLFIEIGTVPHQVLVNDLDIKTNENGYIIVDSAQRCTKEGIWAAGDITDNSNNFHQIITACAEGAVAAQDIFKYLQAKK